MTEREFRLFLKESFDKLAEAFPSVLVDYGLDFNSKKSRWELTYFAWDDQKEGWGAAYIKKDQLTDENYVAHMKSTFIPNMSKALRQHFTKHQLVILP